MAFDFNAAAQTYNKTKEHVVRINKMLRQQMLLEFINENKNKLFDNGLYRFKMIDGFNYKKESIVINGNILEFIYKSENRYDGITFNDINIFNEFIELCKNFGIDTIKTPIYIVAGDDKELYLDNINFSFIFIKGVIIKNMKNVYAEGMVLRQSLVEDQKKILLNVKGTLRIMGLHGFKDFSFIKHCGTLIFQTLEVYTYNNNYQSAHRPDWIPNDMIDLPLSKNLKGLSDTIEHLYIIFGNTSLQKYKDMRIKFTTKYIPDTLKRVTINFNKNNIDAFNFKYLPIPGEEGVDYELYVQANGMGNSEIFTVSNTDHLDNNVLLKLKNGEYELERYYNGKIYICNKV